MFETGMGLVVVTLPNLYILLRAVWKSGVKKERTEPRRPYIIINTETGWDNGMGSFVGAISSVESQSQIVQVSDLEKRLQEPPERTLQLDRREQ